MYRKILIVAIATLLFSSKLCAQDLGAGFVLPTIPESITTAEDRADYLALHYWDNLGMATIDAQSEIVEQAFADFISILPYTTKRSEAFARLWSRSYPYGDAFYHFLSLSELYLYDVASPMRNEEYYIEALESLYSDASIPQLEREAATVQLELLRKNRVGEVATDFVFVDKEGVEHLFSEYRADYVLLIFASAECDECKRMKQAIDANTRLWMMLRRGSLAIVAITLTMDELAWQTVTTPDRWVSGWDKSQVIETTSLYDLTTKPRLYLLDRQHRILLKNTTPMQVDAFLSAKN